MHGRWWAVIRWLGSGLLAMVGVILFATSERIEGNEENE